MPHSAFFTIAPLSVFAFDTTLVWQNNHCLLDIARQLIEFLAARRRPLIASAFFACIAPSLVAASFQICPPEIKYRILAIADNGTSQPPADCREDSFQTRELFLRSQLCTPIEPPATASFARVKDAPGERMREAIAARPPLPPPQLLAEFRPPDDC